MRPFESLVLQKLCSVDVSSFIPIDNNICRMPIDFESRGSMLIIMRTVRKIYLVEE